ncbi:MAG TPA: tripartite tricarboxylate transporter substrate binding protein [Xanthobacteraceae bacterium]|nr:tripartite tricarboxylate transporter substrate binding protein [Xanthobacteraceae bacterium]
MLVSRRRLGYLAATLVAASVPAANAAADDFPSRPVQLIVPYAPGGSGDLIARLLGDKLSALWGQQVVVENKPGAGGLVGTETAAHAAPDGYTLYLATDGPLTVAATLHRHVPYDWKRDFTPVSMITVGFQVLIIDPKLPAKTLAEFIALAKSKPGALNFASIGVGTAPHLAAELFLATAGLKLTHVPYNGSSAQAIRAMIAGDVAMFMVGTSTALPFIKNGNVRALAVTSNEGRVDGLPDVPTFAEAGYPQVDYSLWFSIAVPSATPAAVVNKLNADINKVVTDPGYMKALADRGFKAKGSTPSELAAFMEKDYIKNRDLIQKLGLQVD